MAVLDITAPAEVEGLMTSKQYEEFLSKQKH